MYEHEYIHLLSILSLARGQARVEAEACLNDMDDEKCEILSGIAAAHHVVIRGLEGPNKIRLNARFASLVQAEHDRAQHAIARLFEVRRALDENNCPVVVIKSLDHWPDFGTDLDLLTLAPEAKVVSIMRDRFGASIETPTWSDRVARKLNFRLPGLPELVEIHFGRVGQAGEQVKLADRIMQRRVLREYAGKPFWVPAPEERIILATLQRLYRHYYFRVCDVANARDLINSGTVDFDELRRASKSAGIWPGVATFLRLTSDYVSHYSGQHLMLPRRVWLASSFGIEKVYPNAGFLRLPLFPQGAGLYLRQLVRAMRRRDARGSIRLGLVPPLAIAANVRFKALGDEHGIW
jgi:hypothetical protein